MQSKLSKQEMYQVCIEQLNPEDIPIFNLIVEVGMQAKIRVPAMTNSLRRIVHTMDVLMTLSEAQNFID